MNHMTNTVIVVGPMRTGTSLAAGILHRLGWHAGVKTFLPQPPTWRLDYEEPELSELLVQRLWPTGGWWIDYIRRRHADSKMLGMEGRIVLKCPYLALCWGDLTLAVERVDGHAPFVVRTYREQTGVEASMAANPRLSRKDQSDIVFRLHRDVSPSVELCYDAMIDSPGPLVRALAARLGVVDDGAIQGAVALVGRPTTYATSTPQPEANRA